MIKVLVLAIGLAVVFTISAINDRCIEKKGGETHYIWEKGALHEIK